MFNLGPVMKRSTKAATPNKRKAPADLFVGRGRTDRGRARRLLREATPQPTPEPKKHIKSKKTPSKDVNLTPSGPNLIGPQTMVTVEVGPEGAEKQTFIIHKNFICHYSPYFTAAFNGNFAEALTQKVTLTDTNPKAFGIFVNWLYSQTIIDDNHTLPSATEIINLWILGDKILVPKLQNHAIKALSLSNLAETINEVDFCHVYENTAPDSPLRGFLAEACAAAAGFKIAEGDEERYPQAMLVDVVNAMKVPQRKVTAKVRERAVEEYFVAENVPAWA